MRKLNYLLGLIILTGLVFASCSKDEDPNPPTINFKGGTHVGTGMEYIDGDVTLSVASQFMVGITASSASDANLKNIKVVRDFENVITITQFDSTFNASNFAIDIIFLAYPTAGTEVWTFTATDKNDKQTSISFTITTEEISSGIIEYNDKLLGSHQSSNGSSFASFDGSVYSLADAKANADKVDFLYFYGATNLATIAAPDDATAATVFFDATNGLQTWSVLNNTRFTLTDMTPEEYNGVLNSASLIVIVNNANPTESKVNQLAVDDVVAFKTAAGKYGMFIVTNLVEGAAGDIEISVKIED
jgi:hypothetical protein